MRTVKSLVLVILGIIILWGSTITTYATNEVLVKDTGYIEANVTVPEGFDTTITINLLTEDGQNYSVILEAKNKYKTNEKIPVGKYATSININNNNKYLIECLGKVVIEKDKKTGYVIRIKDRNTIEQDKKNSTSKRDASEPLRKESEDTTKINTSDIEQDSDEQEAIIKPERTNLESPSQEVKKVKENSTIEDKKPSESAAKKVGDFGYSLFKKNISNLIMIVLCTVILVIIKVKKKYF